MVGRGGSVGLLINTGMYSPFEACLHAASVLIVSYAQSSSAKSQTPFGLIFSLHGVKK